MPPSRVRPCSLCALLLLATAPVLPAQEAGKAAKARDTIVRLTNAFRDSQKRQPLKVNDTLSRLAQKHAENMAKQEKCAHVLDGKAVKDRAEAAGYKYANLGENVAHGRGPGDPGASLVTTWKMSPGHRKNMLNPKYTQIGVGVAQGGSGEWYGCQVFGTPRGPARVKPPEKLLTITVSVTNDTDQTVRLKVGEDVAELKPGTGANIEAGRPSRELPVEVLPKPPTKPVKATLRDGGKYTIVSEKGILTIREKK